MTQNLIKKQQKNLKQLVKQHAGTSLFAHLGLVGLKKHRDFDLLHQAFAQGVPVHTVTSFQQLLLQMTRVKSDPETEVIQSLSQKNVTTTKKLVGLCYWKGGLVPVTRTILDNYYASERKVFQQLAQQGVKPSGLTFTLFEREKGHVDGLSQLSVTGWNRLIQEQRPFFGRQKFLPQPEQLINATGSRFQWFNAMLDVLKEHGKKVETLVAHPATLVDFALFAAQQEGRFVPLSDLCPNLKVYLYTSNTLSPYRTELAYFFRDLQQTRWLQFYHNPAGFFASQPDMNVREQLKLQPEKDIFYEFVPEDDIDADGQFVKNYRRLHIGQIQAKRRYAMLITNDAGLLGVHTQHMVFIKSTDPFRFSLLGSPKRLTTMGEGFYEHDVASAIDGINSALSGRGLFIRNFMCASRRDTRQMHWLLEVSRPVEHLEEDVLSSIAERLKAELCMKVPSMQQIAADPSLAPIQVIFAPMGTLAAVAGDRRLPKLDHSLDAKLLQKVIDSAWTTRVVEV